MSSAMICLLLLLPFYLTFGLPLERQRRTTSDEILGDLVAEESGQLNLGYAPKSNCKEILDEGFLKSGLYRLDLSDGKGEFNVFCDMNLQGGGWTIIQRRVNSSISFNLTKFEYERGFGNFVSGNFWLGLDKINRLTNHNGLTFELYFGLERFFGGSSRFGKSRHSSFRVGDSASNYQLIVAEHDVLQSDISDSFFPHNGSSFSTPDNDVDSDSGRHCAQEFSSGWWYSNCLTSHLNGIYYDDGVHSTSTLDGIIWQNFGNSTESLKTTVMAIRPIS